MNAGLVYNVTDTARGAQHRRCIRGFQKSIFNKHGEKWSKTTTAVCIFSLLQYYIEMACGASSVGSPLSMGAADRDVTELPSSVV